MSGTGRFPSIAAEPEPPPEPPLWAVLWRSLRPTEWATLVVVVAGVWALFWWLSGDPVVAVFVLAAVSGVVAVAVTLAWTIHAMRSLRRRVALVESWQTSDRAQLLDHVAAERNRRLDGMPVQRDTDGSTW